jgi:hypothetical protein
MLLPFVSCFTTTAFVVLLLATTAGRVHADTIQLSPSRVQVLKGRVSGQPLNVLSLREQQNQQNDWNTYIEIDGNQQSLFQIQFDFTLISSSTIDVSNIQNMTLQINSMGLPYSLQRRTWRAKKDDGTWLVVADNKNAPSWSWFFQNVTIANPPNIIQGSTLSLQLLSNNKKDVVDLDYLVVSLVTKDKAPTKSPTKAPTKVPTVTKSPTKSPTKAPTTAPAIWQPKASDKLTLQYQLQGVIDTFVNTSIFDIDLFAAARNGTVINTLHNKGAKVVCYFSAGSYESWREDWSQYFRFITKNVYYSGTNAPFAAAMADWPGERWLDISRIDLLEPIMKSRMELAARIGCDAVDPDNMDGYTNPETGIALTGAQQLAYNKRIAEIAHSYGLAVGLKNDLNQLANLVNWYDFALNEQCFQYNECSLYSAFTDVDKPVYGVEYSGDPAVFCPKANNMKLSFSKKKLDLQVYRVGCENY